MSDPDLQDEVQGFAQDCCARISATLQGEPQSEPLTVTRSPDGKRCAFKFRHTLVAPGVPGVVGVLEVSFAIGRDRPGQFMAVHDSRFRLLGERGSEPIIRMEYLREAGAAPSSHIHVHAQSGPLTLLLARTGHKSPAAVQSIHIPTGGERFRPCVEDFIEFLIVDCGVSAHLDWRTLVDEGRAQWRDYQARAVVRDRPEVAAKILRDMGADVTLPEGGLSGAPRNAY